MPSSANHHRGSFASTELVTVSGCHVQAPSLQAIHHELGQLSRAPFGSSLTIVSGARTLRVKFRPGAGFDVLTYRSDHAVDGMFTTPARVVWKTDRGADGAGVECSALLSCIASFLAQADHAA